MLPISTHATTFHSLCVCVLVTSDSFAKTDELIEMPFGKGQTRVGPRNHTLNGA